MSYCTYNIYIDAQVNIMDSNGNLMIDNSQPLPSCFAHFEAFYSRNILNLQYREWLLSAYYFNDRCSTQVSNSCTVNVLAIALK